MYLVFSVAAVVYILAFILISQWFVPAPYTWVENTVSELASQGYRGKWLMQLGFVGFGLLLSVAVILSLRSGVTSWYEGLTLLLYAISILMAGFFCEKPFEAGIAYSKSEAQLHSIFAQIAGFSLSMSMFLSFLMTQEIWHKTIHFLAFLFVIGMSMSFGFSSNFIGLIQRIMYLGSFAWILFAMTKY